MELIVTLLFLLFFKTHSSSTTNDNAAAGEIWTNQTDIGIVNGTQIQNMLQKCDGCIINVKAIPSDDISPNSDKADQKDVVNSQKPTSKKKVSSSLSDEKDIKVEHVSVLNNLVKQCPGCYADYQDKPILHGNKVTKKVKKGKKKKKKHHKEQNEIKGEDIHETPINDEVGKDAVQPPEISVPKESKDASESYTLNDLSSTSNSSSEANLMVFDVPNSNATNGLQNNPTDEQLGNYTQPFQPVESSRNSTDEKPELINRKEDSIANNPGAEQITPLNASDTRSPSEMPEAAGPIMVELGSHNQANENMIDYISPKDFKKLLKRKEEVHLIDLREQWEINHAGKVKNAIHIPLNSLGLALKLTENKFKMKYGFTKPETDDCNIVFMDSTGERSDIAYKYAKEHGYQCPRSLVGGFDSWRSVLGAEETLYDDIPKVNLTKIDVPTNLSNKSHSQLEMKMKKTFIHHQ